MKKIEKKIESEKINPIKKNNNSDTAIVLLLVLIMGILMIGVFYLLRKEIHDLEDELVKTKNVLSEYGIYIDSQPQTSTSYDTSVYNIIKPSDIAKKSKGKTIVLWVGRQSCGYCSMYAPYLNDALNTYGIKAYYIDLAQLVEFNVPQPYVSDEEEYGILVNLKGDGEWDGYAAEYVGGTPLTLVIKDNKVVGGLSGYTDSVANILNVFDKAGVKKN